MKAYLIAYLAKMVLRLLFWSYRIKLQGLDRFTQTAEKGACILMLWHNRLGIAPELLNYYASHLNYVAFVSKSRDGELLAILANSYSAGRTIRVPAHNRHHALKVSIDGLKKRNEVLVLTPDGPRGPRYRVKPGVALAARAACAPVVPFTWKANRYWQLKTWDGFMLPKPFATLEVMFGEPIAVSEEHYPDLSGLTAAFEKALSIDTIEGD